MQKYMLKLFVLAGLSTAVLAGCSKENDPADDNNDTDTSVTTDYAQAQNIDDELVAIINEAADDRGLKKTGITWYINGCTTVTIDTASTPDKMTIDFGQGCTGNDGRIRAGKVIVTWTGRYRDSGTVVTMTTDNYSVNGNKVEGVRTVTNKGKNTSGQPHFSVLVTGGKVTLTDGRTILWNSERTRTWTGGFNTFDPMDDVYAVTGTASGTAANGIEYTAKITKALVAKVGCRWIVSGTMEVEPKGHLKRVVDFGDGNCDNKATVTIGRRTYDIEMR